MGDDEEKRAITKFSFCDVPEVCGSQLPHSVKPTVDRVIEPLLLRLDGTFRMTGSLPRNERLAVQDEINQCEAATL